MVHEDSVWIGTGSASFHTFKISSTVSGKPGEQKRQLEKLKQSNTSQFERRVSQSMVVKDNGDEGLVSEKKSLLMTVTPGEDLRDPEKDTPLDPMVVNSLPSSHRQLSRKAFGRTFYRQIRREMQLEAKREGLYQLEHTWSGCLNDKECPKVTTIKPIIRQARVFMHECNSSQL